MQRSTLAGAAAAALIMACAPPALAQTVSPESVGLSSASLARLDKAMERDVANHRRAGMVVLVAREGKVAHLRAYGMADVEAGRPMTTDSIFRMNSQTKPMVTVALLMLWEEGKFQLTDPVETYIPSFAGLKVYDGVDAEGRMKLRAPKRKMTILDVLRHTSGMGDAYRPSSESPAQKLWNQARPGDTLADEMATFSKLPLVYDPGAEWRYGPEHEIIAYLVERFSGQPLDQFMKERIFTPLGMKDTFYRPTPAQLARYTTLYSPDGKGGLKPTDEPRTSPYLKYAARMPSGSSGLSGTAQDQFRFGQMLLNGGELDGVRLLSRKTVELMLSDQLPPEVKSMSLRPGRILEGQRYGLGIGVLGDVAASGRPGSLGVADWSGSSNTDMWIDPKEKMIIIALTQYRPGEFAWLYRVEQLAYQSVADAGPPGR